MPSCRRQNCTNRRRFSHSSCDLALVTLQGALTSITNHPLDIKSRSPASSNFAFAVPVDGAVPNVATGTGKPTGCICVERIKLGWGGVGEYPSARGAEGIVGVLVKYGEEN